METKNILLLAGFAVVIAVIFVFSYIGQKKRKDSSWMGTVIDKNMSEHVSTSSDDRSGQSVISFGTRPQAVNKSYSVRIRTDKAEEFDWPVGQGLYESITVGDRLIKSPGTETPVKM